MSTITTSWSIKKLTLMEKLVKVYPFKRDVVDKKCKNLLRKPNFLLLEPITLEGVDMSVDPTYCPYHHRLCYIIKYWIECFLYNGAIELPKECLIEYSPS